MLFSCLLDLVRNINWGLVHKKTDYYGKNVSMNSSCGRAVGKSFQFILCLTAFVLVWSASVIMEFDLTAFTPSPSTEQFNRCRKDLFKIAEFFKIVVPHKDSKKEVKTVLHQEFIMQRILPNESGMSGIEARSPTPTEVNEKPASAPLSPVSSRYKAFAPVSSTPFVPRSDPLLMLRAKEVELEIKREESEKKRLRIRELELEMERERFQRNHGRPHPTGTALDNSPVSPSFAHLPNTAPCQSPPIPFQLRWRFHRLILM